MSHHTFVISEIGVNHNGDINLAKKLIDESKKAGADAVKFQSFTAESLVGENVSKVKYQVETTGDQESHFDMIKNLELSLMDQKILFDYCNQVGIEFISTPYDLDSARFLVEELQCKTIKVASADIIDYFLHEYLATTNCHVIISTGMASLGEIEKALNLYDFSKTKVSLLQCVSNYPCSIESLNLNVIESLEKIFELPVGYSDHAKGSLSACIAVAKGATIIEKHFTLDKEMKGPDHRASLDPIELVDYIQQIRNTEKILGHHKKIVQEEEKEMRSISRKSLTLKKNVSLGESLKEELFTAKRPGTGISPFEIKSLISKGAKFKVDLDKNTTIKPQHLIFE